MKTGTQGQIIFLTRAVFNQNTLNGVRKTALPNHCSASVVVLPLASIEVPECKVILMEAAQTMQKERNTARPTMH